MANGTKTKYTLLASASIALLSACGGGSSDTPQKPDNGDTPDKGAWSLVWQDEFDGDQIDMNKWEFEQNCWGGGNGEQQCYTDKADNAFVRDGHLHIVAINENFTGPLNPEAGENWDVTRPYTSARLRTKDKGDWTYGRFEIRARMPEGQGTWPAIWMLPTDQYYGGWAASGEIDIMEAVNLKAASDSNDPNIKGLPERRIHGTLHFGESWPYNVHSGTEYYLPDDMNPADDFHTYAVEWEKDEIRWYVDDIHYATQRSSGWYSQYWDDAKQELVLNPDDAPFNQPFHMVLNLAVGGSWAGNTNEGGIQSEHFPQTMEVDFVRAYTCSLDTTTGLGCASNVDASIEVLPGHQPRLP